MSIRHGFNLPFCPLALFRKEGSCFFNNKPDITFAKGSSQGLVEHTIVRERGPSRLCARYGEEVGGFLTATIAMTHSTNKSRGIMRPQALV